MQKMDKQIRLALIRSGVKCDHLGFTYLLEAIKETIKNPKATENLNNLFKKIAKKLGKDDYFYVETDSRNCILQLGKRGFSNLDRLFGFKVWDAGHIPSTAEFINLMKDYYKNKLYKNTPSLKN